MAGLTDRQLAFCLLYAKNPTIQGACDAYRSAYKTRASEESVNRAARRLLQNPAVAGIVGLAREKAAERVSLTLEDHLDKLAELRDAAADNGQFSSAVSAEKARGQAAGLYVEKQHVQGDIQFFWKGDCETDFD